MRAVVQAAARRARPWPDWDMPADDECYQFAKATTKYLRFLSPKIIEAVVQNNEENRNMFCDYLNEAGIDPELYLWDKSSCCFPGMFATSFHLMLKSKKNEDPRWDLDEFEWAEPVGTLENMEAFLTDRQKKIKKMLETYTKKANGDDSIK